MHGGEQTAFAVNANAEAQTECEKERDWKAQLAFYGSRLDWQNTEEKERDGLG
jgi:hypothetical protein